MRFQTTQLAEIKFQWIGIHSSQENVIFESNIFEMRIHWYGAGDVGLCEVKIISSYGCQFRKGFYLGAYYLTEIAGNAF